MKKINAIVMAALAASAIAGAGFATAQVREGAGMWVVIALTTLWIPMFVALNRR